MRILVVDNNLELCNILREFFDTQEDMEYVGEAHDGEQALEKIQSLAPDVVILDITMPHLDGLGVLECLDTLELEVRPHIIVLTAFGKDDLISRLTELGVDYFIIKPFNLSVLADRIRQFTHASKPVKRPEITSSSRPVENKENRIVRIMHELGIPPHFKGFVYLRDAVIMCMDKGYVGGALTKELYPNLAERYETTSGGVEAAIRNAVIAAWENGNRDYMIKLCGSHRGHRVPTNSLIIAKLAEEANSPELSQLGNEKTSAF